MRSLLLIAHPGHELRIWGWVGKRRPDVVVLTLGDGSAGGGRLAASMAGLAARGLRIRTDWLEPVSDSVIYRALLGECPSPFSTWVDRLKSFIWEEGITEVVADEAEGYNPTHELCRVMANVLVSRMFSEGREVRNLGFPLVGHPCDARRATEVAEELTLDSEGLRAKIAAMRAYAVACQQARLREEGEAALREFGDAAFGKECLYPARATAYEAELEDIPTPHFESVGEQRQAAGVYREVIRAAHVRNLVSSMYSSDASKVRFGQ